MSFQPVVRIVGGGLHGKARYLSGLFFTILNGPQTCDPTTLAITNVGFCGVTALLAWGASGQHQACRQPEKSYRLSYHAAFVGSIEDYGIVARFRSVLFKK